MRLLICGSRTWLDWKAIEREILKRRKEIDVIIHGGARGADSAAGMIGHRLSIKVIVFQAQWDKLGRSAGPKRNQQMLDEGKPDEVWAFSQDLKNSRGTKDMVHRATRAGIPYKVFNS